MTLLGSLKRKLCSYANGPVEKVEVPETQTAFYSSYELDSIERELHVGNERALEAGRRFGLQTNAKIAAANLR